MGARHAVTPSEVEKKDSDLGKEVRADSGAAKPVIPPDHATGELRAGVMFTEFSDPNAANFET